MKKKYIYMWQPLPGAGNRGKRQSVPSGAQGLMGAAEL